jgi:hypothetical protein
MRPRSCGTWCSNESRASGVATPKVTRVPTAPRLGHGVASGHQLEQAHKPRPITTPSHVTSWLASPWRASCCPSWLQVASALDAARIRNEAGDQLPYASRLSALTDTDVGPLRQGSPSEASPVGAAGGWVSWRAAPSGSIRSMRPASASVFSKNTFSCGVPREPGGS